MDDGRQYRRQSQDFGEIWNVQTNLNVTEQRYQEIFHNWKNPSECKQNRPGSPCWVCSELKSVGKVKDSSVKILVIKNLSEIKELISNDLFKAIIYIGLEEKNQLEKEINIPIHSLSENLQIDNLIITQNFLELENFLNSDSSYMIVNSLTKEIIN